MSETLLLIGLLCFVIAMLIGYIFYRDYALAQRFSRLAAIINRLVDEKDRIESSFAAEQEANIEAIKLQSAEIIVEQIKNVQESIRDFQVELDTQALRLDRLEARFNEYVSVPVNNNIDTSRLIAMYNSGAGIEEIAHKLRIGASEVTLALKLNNIITRADQ
jgi:allophanate hydrolase subunit 1